MYLSLVPVKVFCAEYISFSDFDMEKIKQNNVGYLLSYTITFNILKL